MGSGFCGGSFMASGDFHGGSSHTGSYHSSGGGGYSDGGYGGDVEGFMVVGGTIVAVVLFILAHIQKGTIPGLNLVNLCIFIAAGLLFIPGFKESKRTAGLGIVKRNPGSRSIPDVRSEFISPERTGNKYIWAGKNDKNYFMSFNELEYRKKIIPEVSAFMRRTPWIIWMRPGAWMAIALGITVCNLFFYEAVIPVFEKTKMTDQAFAFFDKLIFYLPSCLALLCPILCYIFVRVRDSYLYRFTVGMAEDIMAEENKQITETLINSKLSEKWYYKICPNCGNEALSSDCFCIKCGSSLEVISNDVAGKNGIRRLSVSDKEN